MTVEQVLDSYLEGMGLSRSDKWFCFLIGGLRIPYFPRYPLRHFLTIHDVLAFHHSKFALGNVSFHVASFCLLTTTVGVELACDLSIWASGLEMLLQQSSLESLTWFHNAHTRVLITVDLSCLQAIKPSRSNLP